MLHDGAVRALDGTAADGIPRRSIGGVIHAPMIGLEIALGLSDHRARGSQSRHGRSDFQGLAFPEPVQLRIDPLASFGRTFAKHLIADGPHAEQQ